MVTKLREITIRGATKKDQLQIANLIHFERNVHRHLDWRSPLDRIGEHPFLIAEKGNKIVSVLACPIASNSVAWIRLFAASSEISTPEIWKELWHTATSKLREGSLPVDVVVMPLKKWFQDLLEKSDLNKIDNVIVLSWNQGNLPVDRDVNGVHIRQMNDDDMPQVAQIDLKAFQPVWRNSQNSLEAAYLQAAVATVAEFKKELVGYQISTHTSLGGHLARLAVLPKAQSRGIGYLLVHDLLEKFLRKGVETITVNTQEKNLPSLAIYQKIGFKLSGEKYPVYLCKLR